MLYTEQMAFETFLLRDFSEPVEWVKGRAVPLTPVQRQHAELSVFLLKAIGAYVEARELGEVLSEPFIMKTGPDLPGRSPDLIFVAKENLSRLQPLFLDGPADLVVEIVSPESRGRDRGDKFYEYEQGGVPEYWLLDPFRKHAEFYHLVEQRYQLVLPAETGGYTSRVIEGLAFEVSDFWRRPFPPLLGLLRGWGLLSG